MDESDKKDNPENHGKSKQKTEILLSDDSTSISLNSYDLPDNTKPPNIDSESSTISEHLDSLQSSIENDRSLPEISLKQDFLKRSNDYEELSYKSNEAANNIQVILNDILNDKQFCSKSDGTKIEKSDSCSSRDVSLNIFEGVSLDDSSINNYVSKLKGFNPSEGNRSRKNSLSVDLDASSITATEYKCYQDDSNKIVNYQDAIAHRDRQIRHLEDILQQMCENRDELQKQSENFVSKIHQLEKQLKEYSSEIKQHQCISDSEQWSPIHKKLSLKSFPSTDLFNIEDSSLNRGEKINDMGIDKIFRKFEEILSPNQLIILNELKSFFEFYVQKRVGIIRDEHKNAIKEFEEELKKELGDKHNKELEDLRVYYEEKCVELEKNYSEEIFSRKLSNDSSINFSIEHDQSFINEFGPGGDADSKKLIKNISNDDLSKINKELNQFLIELNQGDKISVEIIPTFSKLIFNDVQNEIRNKYNAELEILRDDYENKIDEKNVEFTQILNNLKQQHEEELKRLQNQTQEVISNDFEIVDVVTSYERRLQEQIDLARIDIIKNLMQEIKKLAQNSDDSYWPKELLQIKDCFQEKYEAEIDDLKEKHEEEVKGLKEEHFKVLSGALERARMRSVQENESFEKVEGEILQDRDGLKKSNVILKNVINELLKYFTQCEDELNKTLIDEILKLDQNETVDNSLMTESFIKRVHFTPNLNLIDSSIDSIDFKNELGSCLDRLKSDANTILALSSNIKQQKTDDLTDDDLLKDKEYIKTLESERNHLQNQIEQLTMKQKIFEKDLENSNRKIAELIECGRKEIVSEGYGESSLDGQPGKIGSLVELQEKARHLAAEWKNGADHPLLELIEELCREGERIGDESKKDKNDLIQQIEAAEKKLRSTNRFLEEQAMEREQERSDAQKDIENLHEMLKEKAKEGQNRNLIFKEDGIWKLNECCHNAINFVNSTVEHLERQMHEMTRLQESNEAKLQVTETERKEAIDKISDLRDIIRDLDNQVKEKTVTENELKEIISKLKPVVKQQSETIDELYEQLENYKLGPDVEFFKGKIVGLEKEIQQLRINSELAGSEGVIKEIQLRLYEFENSIDKKTRELEGLHSSSSVLSTACSTPSDEMSYRDQVRPNTPGSVFDECDVPLQQLARLKEKLIKHSRAEDAALKRIRDLEMQLVNIKQELEDSQNEKDLLQSQVTEQIVLLSSLQMRLDEQRLKAEQNQKQANTSLELKIYDLENEIQQLKDTMHAKDKNLKQLNKIIDETKRRLEDREKELNNREDDEILINFEKEMIKLKEENQFLKTKMQSDAQNAQILPGLVDNIIADKNSDIEKLRLKLDDTQKQLESFLSLNLDYDQLKHISRMKSSERGFSDFLNLTPIARRNENKIDSIENSMNFNPRNPNETKIDFNLVQNSTEIQPKKVHFDDEEKIKKFETKIEELNENILKLEENLQELKENFESERKTLQFELAEKKMKLGDLENELKSSVDDHKRKDEMYFNLAKEKRDFEIKINEINRVFEEKNEEIKQLQGKIEKVNENSIENDMLKSKINEGEIELKRFNDLIIDKNCEIEILNEDIQRYQNELHDLKGQEEKNIEIIKLKSIQDDLKKEINRLQEFIQEKDNIIEQMQKDTVSLHTNLETIQSKIQETGNIVDLRKRLQEEKHLNAILKEEIDSLKNPEREEKCSSIEHIQGEVQKQLEYSAHLDLNLIQALSEDEKDTKKDENLQLKIELEKSEVLLENERQKVLKLNGLLEKERFLLNSIQIEDSNLIEQLRIKCESVLEQRDELESVLDQERKVRFNLENEVKKLKSDLSLSSTEYKKLPSAESLEIVKLKEEINLNNEKNESLQSQVRNLKISKNELNSNLKYTKEMLSLKLKELEHFEIKLQNFKIKEDNLKEKLSEIKFELNRKNEETQSNRVLLNQLEEERINLKKDQIVLNDRIRTLEEDRQINDILNEERNVSLNSPVPEKLLNKMRELTIEIKQQMEENKILTYNLTKIATERSKLLDKIRRLEQINTNLNYENPQKTNQIFAKYLRSESYRKALVFQKHFLIKLLASYQKINTKHHIENIFEPKHPIKITEPIKKFKSCVFAIIATQRMKFMVHRWHSGVRNYSNDTRKYRREENDVERNDYDMKFEVGQPVSSQNFRRGDSRSPHLMGSSWSGSTAPQKERPLSTQSDFAPLQTPLLLSEYVQRFDEMQKRLGLTFEKINS